MTPELEAIIRRFLHYSLRPVDYNYDLLTLVTREEFETLVAWLRSGE